ncbi:MAG: DUF1989 domain-containing protein, partial [Thiobacillus sp.]|nr:DUF1989 domain-containing protein [Thiobacillus sp.]
AGPDPAEAACEIGHGAAALVEAAAGQLLTIEDVGGDRAAQLFAFTRTDAREFLSPHHTRVFSNSYRLTLGMRLVDEKGAAVADYACPDLHDAPIPLGHK